MMLHAIASLVLAAGQPAPDPAPPYGYDQPADEATETAEEAADEALEAAEDAAEAAAEAVEEATEAVEEAAEDEAMVCRRQSYYDDFGRQRSRKSCRPRDDG